MWRYLWWLAGGLVMLGCLCAPVWPQHNVMIGHARIANNPYPTEFSRSVPFWESDWCPLGVHADRDVVLSSAALLYLFGCAVVGVGPWRDS